MRPRFIPVLLLKDGGLVKSVKFKNHRYVGDPINAIRIFNEKEVDELVFFDIGANTAKNGPQFSMIRDLAEECFMPFGYGGGVSTVEHGLKLVSLGVEKVVLNTNAAKSPQLVRDLAAKIGSQSVVVCVDIGSNWRGKPEVRAAGGTETISSDPVAYCKQMEELGAGEIILQSIDRDGTFSGYDLEMIKAATGSVNVPVVACGGAGKVEDMAAAVKSGASAAAAGSLFVFYGKHRAVLVNYPTQAEIKKAIETP